ncbi:MAG: hypothetical protein R3A44_13790 [Caldilineaceae bacterium]
MQSGDPFGARGGKLQLGPEFAQQLPSRRPHLRHVFCIVQRGAETLMDAVRERLFASFIELPDEQIHGARILALESF